MSYEDMEVLHDTVDHRRPLESYREEIRQSGHEKRIGAAHLVFSKMSAENTTPYIHILSYNILLIILEYTYIYTHTPNSRTPGFVLWHSRPLLVHTRV